MMVHNISSVPFICSIYITLHYIFPVQILLLLLLKTVYLLGYYANYMHIITYVLIFRTNKIYEGQFLAESFVEAL